MIAKSKNLRSIDNAVQTFGAKIPRFRSATLGMTRERRFSESQKSFCILHFAFCIKKPPLFRGGFYYFLVQVLRENRTKMGKISNLPASIPIIMVSLDRMP